MQNNIWIWSGLTSPQETWHCGAFAFQLTTSTSAPLHVRLPLPCHTMPSKSVKTTKCVPMHLSIHTSLPRCLRTTGSNTLIHNYNYAPFCRGTPPCKAPVVKLLSAAFKTLNDPSPRNAAPCFTSTSRTSSCFTPTSKNSSLFYVHIEKHEKRDRTQHYRNAS